MPERPVSILQYVHRTNRAIGRSLLRLDLSRSQDAEAARDVVAVRRGLELARLTLARCGPGPTGLR